MSTPARYDEFPTDGPCLTVFHKDKGIATKRIWRENGQVCKDGSQISAFTGGFARQLHLGHEQPLEMLAYLLQQVGENELITYGTSTRCNGQWARAMTKKQYNDNGQPADAVTRTKEHLSYPEGPGIFAGDYDPPRGSHALAPQQLIDALRVVVPPFSDVPILWRPSSGSCIYDTQSGEELVGIKGQRVWIAVKDATDIKRFGETINARAILSGYGWAFISRAGSIQVRSLLDAALFQPHQPDYVAPASVDTATGIQQRMPPPVLCPGSIPLLDTHLLPSLSYEEEERLREMKAAIARAAQPEADRVRLDYTKAQVQHLISARGYDEARARAIVNARLCHELQASDVLYFDHLNQPGYAGTTVAEVLANPDAFDGKTLADPLEPDYGGAPGTISGGKAKIFLNRETRRPAVNSFAHGGAKYTMFYDAPTLIDLFSSQADRREKLDWLHPLLNAKLTSTDTTVVLREVTNITGHKLRDLRADLESRLAARRRETAQADRTRPQADGRRPLEVDSADWAELVAETGRAIAADTRGKPVFSFAGQYVTVYTQEPASITLPDVDAGYGVAYPPMPVIGYYRPAGFKTRIAESVAFHRLVSDTGEMIPTGVPTGLPESVLAEFEKPVPELKGIIEHPSIDPNGRILMDHGYDRETGLFLHLGGQCFLPVPDAPTRDDALAAYDFLRNEVLAEFPFAEEIDAVVAVSMFLTKVQVRFFGSCPLYAVTASIQSSGKTELTNVVSLSIDGRPIATQAWPTTEDECGKVITSCLREGHSLVMFDNVPDGERVRSPKLAAAVTSDVYRDRILGLSENISVPANMMFSLTGNNLAFAGDMPTRTLVCYLDPRRGDPQKRTFSRPNLKAWCLADRARTIQAALVILRAFHTAGRYEAGGGSRFPLWQRCVRDPLVWLGKDDLLGVFDDVVSNDPDGDENRQVLELLAQAYPEGFTARAISDYVRGWGSSERFAAQGEAEHVRELGRELGQLLGFNPAHADAFTQKLGTLFQRLHRRRIGGMWLERLTKRKPVKWVVRCEDAE